MSTILANISQARRLLETARSLDDVLKIRDKAKVVETYVKAARESLAVSNQAAEIKVRAERKAGAMIAAMEKAQGRRTDRAQLADKMSASSKKSQLGEIGLTQRQASRFESMARVPDEQSEKLVDAEKATAENREITSKSIQDAGRKPHVTNNCGNNEWFTPPE